MMDDMQTLDKKTIFILYIKKSLYKVFLTGIVWF